MIVRSRNTLKRRLISMGLVLFVVVGSVTKGASVVLAAAPPQILSYQGRVLNANGVPVSDAAASMKFELYTALAGGTCLWSNSSTTCDSNTPASTTARTVTLTDGLFTEQLGDTGASSPYAAIGSSVFADNSSVYLQVYVNGEALSPRKQIVSAPFAINSSLLDGFDTTSSGSTDAAIPVFDSSGNLMVTGSPTGSGITNASLVVNPATATTDDTIFGVGVGGVLKFKVNYQGAATIGGGLSVNGGVIDSSSAITIASYGGNIALNPHGTGLAYVAAGDDFAVGGTSLVAPFSVDESTNSIRIGDGENDANDPSIHFYASNGMDVGTLSFSDSDTFVLSGGNLSLTSNGVLPSVTQGITNYASFSTTLSGTSGANLNELQMYAHSSEMNYSAIEHATSTDHYVGGGQSQLVISGSSATLTRGYGFRAMLKNDSDNASLVQGAGYLAALEGEAIHDGATTLTSLFGVRGAVKAVDGTVTVAAAVTGEVLDGITGALSGGVGGIFTNTSAGTVRYGVIGRASGGTKNYAGYFSGSQVHIDDDSAPNTTTLVNGAGDLYVADALEVDGSVLFGDSAGDDTLAFVSGAIQDPVSFTMNALEAGWGVIIERGSGGNDFNGNLLHINQGNASATANAKGIVIQNGAQGTGSAGLYIMQAGGHNGIVLDIEEAGSTDNAIVVSSNVATSPNIVFRVTSQGDAYVENAFTGGGADLAEFFLTSDQSLTGYDVVCQDESAQNTVKKCGPGERDVLGVISTNPAFIGNNAGDGTADYRNDPRYRLVGLLGQVETRANAAEGAIAVGDPLTASSLLAGHAAKATSSTRIIGYALDALTSGTGIITVLVSPQWYGGNLLAQDGSAVVAHGDVVVAAQGTATANSNFASGALMLRGSGWDGVAATYKDMSLRTVMGDAPTKYRLSVVNDYGTEVAYVGSSGDLAIAGRLYPSDRGMLQMEKYITYDGSSGPGGDVMRTNASGWAAGSYDFAEMFPSREALAAGEVVVFADNEEEVRRSTGTTYDNRIAGVISTKPGFLAGENLPGHLPVALAGRVPTYVSGENGAINIGDPLTTSSKPGYAMKATEAGPIVGYAMEAFSGTTGVVVTFIRPSYYDGGPVQKSPTANNAASQLASVTSLSVSNLNMNGGTILSIGALSGISQRWRLEENGDFTTHGRIINLVRSYMNEDVETTPALGRETTIQLSGTVRLHDGMAVVDFQQIDPKFNDIISNEVPYRVYVTPAGMTGMLYVANRDMSGFTIRESGTSTDGVDVDWLVIAYHKDFVPQPQEDAAGEPSLQTEGGFSVPEGDSTAEEVPAAPMSEDVQDEVVVEESGTIEETDQEPPIEEAPPEQASVEAVDAQEVVPTVVEGAVDAPVVE